MLRLAACLGVLALVLSLQALGAPQTETKTVQPARFEERNLELQQGDRVAWAVSVQPADARVYFDIHSHDTQTSAVTTHEQRNFSGSIEGTFTAPSTGTFSWLVVNSQNQPVEVTLSTEVNPATTGGKPAPGPEALLLALAGLSALVLLRPPRRSRPALAL